MLTYTSQLKRLILPEYGRNIQRMVDYCLTIENKEERTQCAATIVKTMETLFPVQGDAEAYRRKLWDHLAIMSDFKLDVDLPFELVRPEAFDTCPKPIVDGQSEFSYRHYGIILQNAIHQAAELPDGEERNALIFLLADHMKKLAMTISPDGIDDQKIFDNLYHISHGKIRVNSQDVKLDDYKIVAPIGKKKKKK